jgi:hypothetical protein
MVVAPVHAALLCHADIIGAQARPVAGIGVLAGCCSLERTLQVLQSMSCVSIYFYVYVCMYLRKYRIMDDAFLSAYICIHRHMYVHKHEGTWLAHMRLV